MEHVADRERFSMLATAAPNIFSYVTAAAALRDHALEFEYGMVDPPSARALAKFSCVNCPACRKSVVWVTAITRLDGSWAISHSIEWTE